MTVRDREVVEVLREDPELLAIADAVVETQRLHRRFRPWSAVTVVAVAAALFLLVLASPWDRGDGNGSVLERALAAIDMRGPIVHLTTRFEQPGSLPITSTQSYYDKRRKLVRVVVTRTDGQVLSDYTTAAAEDEFTAFPGLLDGADFYRTALADGRARIVGEGTWQGRPVYWLQVQGGAFVLRIGIDRRTYRPVVFRGVNPDGTSAGFQLAVLGFDYVSTASADLDEDAPVLVRGTVTDDSCSPIRARVDAFLADGTLGGPAVASARAGLDGRFKLRVDPTKPPFRGTDPVRFRLNAQGRNGFGFASIRRVPREGSWGENSAVTITVGDDRIPHCN